MRSCTFARAQSHSLTSMAECWVYGNATWLNERLASACLRCAAVHHRVARAEASRRACGGERDPHASKLRSTALLCGAWIGAVRLWRRCDASWCQWQPL